MPKHFTILTQGNNFAVVGPLSSQWAVSAYDGRPFITHSPSDEVIWLRRMPLAGVCDIPNGAA